MTEKAGFFTPWYVHVRVRIKGQEMFFSVNFYILLYGWLFTVCNTYSFLRKTIRQKKIRFCLGPYCSLKSMNACHFGKSDLKSKNTHLMILPRQNSLAATPIKLNLPVISLKIASSIHWLSLPLPVVKFLVIHKMIKIVH